MDPATLSEAQGRCLVFLLEKGGKALERELPRRLVRVAVWLSYEKLIHFDAANERFRLTEEGRELASRYRDRSRQPPPSVAGATVSSPLGRQLSARGDAFNRDARIGRRGVADIDKEVGRSIALHRKRAGMSTSQLGAALEIRFQQVQKYETGANGVSAARVYQLARVFGVSVRAIYGDAAAELPTVEAAISPDLMGLPETTALLRSYWRLADPRLRTCFRDTIRTLADAGAGLGAKRRGRRRPPPS